jgi:hypothetical protein
MRDQRLWACAWLYVKLSICCCCFLFYLITDRDYVALLSINVRTSTLRRMRLLLCALQIATTTLVVKSSPSCRFGCRCPIRPPPDLATSARSSCRRPITPPPPDHTAAAALICHRRSRGDTWHPRSCPEPGGGSRSRGDTCHPQSCPEPRATGTRGTLGAALSREAGTTPPTRGALGAALSREAGTTPPLPLPRLRRPRPPRPRLPLHQRAIICMWYSPVSVPVTAYTPSRRCNYGGMSVRRCWSLGDTWRPRSCPAPGGGCWSPGNTWLLEYESCNQVVTITELESNSVMS